MSANETSMSTLGVPAGGSSNREKTGERDLCFSSAMRRVPNVRHTDVDLVQWCPVTREIEVIFEASSDPRKSSDITRRIARRLQAYAVLLIHRYKDTEHKFPVTVSVWDPTGRKILSKAEMQWQDLIQYAEHLHNLHTEYRNSIALGNAA